MLNGKGKRGKSRIRSLLAGLLIFAISNIFAPVLEDLCGGWTRALWDFAKEEYYRLIKEVVLDKDSIRYYNSEDGEGFASVFLCEGVNYSNRTVHGEIQIKPSNGAIINCKVFEEGKALGSSLRLISTNQQIEEGLFRYPVDLSPDKKFLVAFKRKALIPNDMFEPVEELCYINFEKEEL